jgi:hypothetical protein
MFERTGHPVPAPALGAFSLAAALAILGSCSPAASDQAPAGSRSASDEPPPGVVQLLPRGGIPAVVDPTFVPAAEADLPDDAWVLGVVLGGEARAYSLNLLNRHEVVNDRIGERSFAAVW